MGDLGRPGIKGPIKAGQEKKGVRRGRLFYLLNTRGGVRTCDLFLRREALYPAELRERETKLYHRRRSAGNYRHMLDPDGLERPFTLFTLNSGNSPNVIHALDHFAKNGVSIVKTRLSL